MKKNKSNSFRSQRLNHYFQGLWGLLLFFCLNASFCQESDEQLINQYIQSHGTTSIVFDSGNIKQFWIEKTIVSRDGAIGIYLSPGVDYNESVPLKIQLANVDISSDCTVDVVSQVNDFSFSVLNDKSKKIAASSWNEDFLQYHIASAVFHLDDTTDHVFYLKFDSKKSNLLSIKKIVLSFKKNKSFLFPPGKIVINQDNVNYSGAVDHMEAQDGANAFSSTGRWQRIFANNKIIVADNDISNSVAIKNIGDVATDIYLGYVPYSNNNHDISNKNIPYKNNKDVFAVLSFEKGSNKIIIDSYPEWEKGCYLALNVKNDLSDFPDALLVNSTISDVKKIDENKSEITFEKNVNIQIKPGTLARINNKEGASYMYTNYKRLNPGEEVTLSSTITKDDDLLVFSTKAFCRGTRYVVPLILSITVGSKESNTILIRDFMVSY